VDFTPQLSRIRKNQERAARLIGDARVVLCQGSRTALSLWGGVIREPARILGAVTTAAEGLALVERERPDLLLASDQLDQGCGIAMAVAVKRRHPLTRVYMVVTRRNRLVRLREAIEACCEVLLLETRMGMGPDLTALRSVCSGDTYIDGEIHAALLRRPDGKPPFPQLSDREMEMLQALAKGESNGDIAQRLFLSVDTVKTHNRSLFAKLEARDRAHAVAIGHRLGFID
jgi:DNA-binding NarL/FixJ family response regulator